MMEFRDADLNSDGMLDRDELGVFAKALEHTMLLTPRAKHAKSVLALCQAAALKNAHYRNIGKRKSKSRAPERAVTAAINALRRVLRAPSSQLSLLVHDDSSEDVPRQEAEIRAQLCKDLQLLPQELSIAVKIAQADVDGQGSEYLPRVALHKLEELLREQRGALVKQREADDRGKRRGERRRSTNSGGNGAGARTPPLGSASSTPRHASSVRNQSGHAMRSALGAVLSKAKKVVGNGIGGISAVDAAKLKDWNARQAVNAFGGSTKTKVSPKESARKLAKRLLVKHRSKVMSGQVDQVAVAAQESDGTVIGDAETESRARMTPKQRELARRARMVGNIANAKTKSQRKKLKKQSAQQKKVRKLERQQSRDERSRVAAAERLALGAKGLLILSPTSAALSGALDTSSDEESDYVSDDEDDDGSSDDDDGTGDVRVRRRIASALHERWRSARYLTDGTFEPRIKDLAGKKFDIANLPFEKLPPYFQHANLTAAHTACSFVEDGCAMSLDLNSASFLEAASANQHEAWMAENPWCTDPLQMIPYPALSAEEKDKDRNVVRIAIKEMTRYLHTLYVCGGAQDDGFEFTDFKCDIALLMKTLRADGVIADKADLLDLDAQTLIDMSVGPANAIKTTSDGSYRSSAALDPVAALNSSELGDDDHEALVPLEKVLAHWRKIMTEDEAGVADGANLAAVRSGLGANSAMQSTKEYGVYVLHRLSCGACFAQSELVLHLELRWRRRQQMRHMARRFREVDANGRTPQGYLELEQLHEILPDTLGEDEIDALVDRFDREHDGRITLVELTRLMHDLEESGMYKDLAQMKRIFDRIDHRKTGAISSAELRHVLHNISDDDFDRLQAEFDVDQSGTFDWDEIRHMHPRIREICGDRTLAELLSDQADEHAPPMMFGRSFFIFPAAPPIFIEDESASAAAAAAGKKRGGGGGCCIRACANVKPPPACCQICTAEARHTIAVAFGKHAWNEELAILALIAAEAADVSEKRVGVQRFTHTEEKYLDKARLRTALASMGVNELLAPPIKTAQGMGSLRDAFAAHAKLILPRIGHHHHHDAVTGERTVVKGKDSNGDALLSPPPLSPGTVDSPRTADTISQSERAKQRKIKSDAARQGVGGLAKRVAISDPLAAQKQRVAKSAAVNVDEYKANLLRKQDSQHVEDHVEGTLRLMPADAIVDVLCGLCTELGRTEPTDAMVCEYRYVLRERRLRRIFDRLATSTTAAGRLTRTRLLTLLSRSAASDRRALGGSSLGVDVFLDSLKKEGASGVINALTSGVASSSSPSSSARSQTTTTTETMSMTDMQKKSSRQSKERAKTVASPSGRGVKARQRHSNVSAKSMDEQWITQMGESDRKRIAVESRGLSVATEDDPLNLKGARWNDGLAPANIYELVLGNGSNSATLGGNILFDWNHVVRINRALPLPPRVDLWEFRHVFKEHCDGLENAALGQALRRFGKPRFVTKEAMRDLIDERRKIEAEHDAVDQGRDPVEHVSYDDGTIQLDIRGFRKLIATHWSAMVPLHGSWLEFVAWPRLFVHWILSVSIVECCPCLCCCVILKEGDIVEIETVDGRGIEISRGWIRGLRLTGANVGWARVPTYDIEKEHRELTEEERHAHFNVRPIKQRVEMELGVYGDDIKQRKCGTLAAFFALFTVDNFILIVIIASALLLALESPLWPADAPQLAVMRQIELAINIIFSLETIFKMIAFGAVFGAPWETKHAYVGDPWNVLDFAIVLISWATFLLDDVTEFKSLRVLRLLRVLRVLRTLNKFPGLKHVVAALLKSVVPLLNVVPVIFLFFLIFAIVCMSYLSGDLRHCVGEVYDNLTPMQHAFIHDPTLGGKFKYGARHADLVAHLAEDATMRNDTSWPAPNTWSYDHPWSNATYAPSLNLMPADNGVRKVTSRVICTWLGGDWEKIVAQDFDNVLHSLSAFFQMSTTEGWVAVTEAAVDSRGAEMQPDIPDEFLSRRRSNEGHLAFFMAFESIGAFFLINLFIGVLIQTFNTFQSGRGSKIMVTPSQQQWIDQRSTMMKNLKPMVLMRRVMPPASGFGHWRCIAGHEHGPSGDEDDLIDLGEIIADEASLEVEAGTAAGGKNVDSKLCDSQLCGACLCWEEPSLPTANFPCIHLPCLGECCVNLCRRPTTSLVEPASTGDRVLHLRHPRAFRSAPRPLFVVLNPGYETEERVAIDWRRYRPGAVATMAKHVSAPRLNGLRCTLLQRTLGGWLVEFSAADAAVAGSLTMDVMSEKLSIVEGEEEAASSSVPLVTAVTFRHLRGENVVAKPIKYQRLNCACLGIRRGLFNFVEKRIPLVCGERKLEIGFEHFIMFCIVVNTMQMSARWFGQPDEMTFGFWLCEYLFAGIFTLEAVIKLVALGAPGYFAQVWNIFDFTIVVATLAGFVPQLFGFESGVGNVATLVRIFRIGRIFRLIQSARSLRAVVNTLVISLPALVNVGMLLLLVFFIYTVIGVQVYFFSCII